MKKRTILIIIVLLLTGLTGCTGGNTETDSNETAVTNTLNPDVTTPAVTEQNGNAVVRSDADGLVEVRIKDGKAQLTFNLEQWDKLYGIFDIYDTLDRTDLSLLRAGPYEINFSTFAGKGW